MFLVTYIIFCSVFLLVGYNLLKNVFWILYLLSEIYVLIVIYFFITIERVYKDASYLRYLRKKKLK